MRYGEQSSPDGAGGIADRTAGFDELLDIGRGDSSDWT
jgi:hypothetical protein